MTLKFQKSHKSIVQFNQVELNDLSIITGVNGSGKTHLLEAIKNGMVLVDNIQSNEIIYFDYKTFFIENEQTFNNQQIIQEKQNAWNKMNQRLGNLVIRHQIQAYKSQLGADYPAIRKIVESKKKPLLKLTKTDFDRNETLYNKYSNYKQQVLNLWKNQNIRNQQEINGIKLIALNSYVSIDELSEIEFKDSYKPIILKNEFLPTQLSKIFLDYKFKEYEELVIKKAEAEHYGEKYSIKNYDDFKKIHGPKPWKVIEEILTKFDTFDYTISNPDKLKFRYHTPSSYTVTLHHKRKGISIPFDHLSSGEKVLFALVLSIYKSIGDRIFPKLLLLDEIDASLHPSMIQNLLNVIHDVFVLEHDVKVILASHSPTTIALSKEEWIYLVNKEGPNRIEKHSRAEALKNLSEGFITLEEGLLITDQIAKNKINIFTEGNNIDYLKKAISLFAPKFTSDIGIIENLKDRTGKNQLKVLYDFFVKMPHKNKVLFVFDCDVNTTFEEANNCYFFIFEKNTSNDKVLTGIENNFPKELFKEEFYIEKPKDDGGTQKSLNKQKFCEYILAQNNAEHFEKFKPLIEKIKGLLTN